MSRRRQATKRPLAKDGKYQNTLVSRLVNTVMISGKKSTAQRIVYGAFDTISEKNPASNPIEILQRAVDNAKPRIETKARRVGGATYQVPLEIPADRQNALALRWIVEFRRQPQRPADEGRARRGNPGSLPRAGQRHPQTGRSSQDGAGKQGLCPFPLVENDFQMRPDGNRRGVFYSQT